MMVRPAYNRDWSAVASLGGELVRAHHAFDRLRFVPPEALSPDTYVSHVRAEVAGGRAVVLVAEDDGVVIGYVFAGIEPASWKELRDEAGYIHDLFVSSPHRRRGIGRLLVRSAMEWLSARGVERLMLWTAPANAAAQHLFRALGFDATMIEMTKATTS
jgi:ribosomal protein S18 acetylase RimI-like enzyme